MKQITQKLIASAIVPAALLTLAACSSDSKPPAPKAETSGATIVQPGVPGGIVVETYTMTANVVHIDGPGREVILATPDGKRQGVKCGPEVVNFDQIRVGDQLKVTVAEEVAVYMASDAEPASTGGGALVALAPKGAKPGGVMAATVQVTATVTAIDLGHHKATLTFADGSTKTVAVRHDVDLTKRKVGEKVVIRKTEAMALSVEKPEKQK